MIKLLFFLIASALSNPITTLINKERAFQNLPPVTYNERLEEDLGLYHKVYGPELIDEHTLEFATFDNYRKKGFIYLTRGSYKKSMENNIKYRLNERECFGPCDGGHFNNYASCNNNPKRCPHFFYPFYITKSLSEIACFDISKENRYYCYGRVGLLLWDNPKNN